LTDLAGSANGNSRVSMYDFDTTAVFTGVFDMTTESIMTSGLFTLKPTNTVADALSLMHAKHVRNIPIVDESGSFVGLFGLRRLSHLLLPKAAMSLGKHSISALHFLPDEIVQMSDRWHEIAEQPVENFLEKESKLLFCTPKTAFPELLALLDESKDTSLPVIVVEGESQKLVGMVSSWDVLEGIIMGRLINEEHSDEPIIKND
jgi:CBS domain-containing protein